MFLSRLHFQNEPLLMINFFFLWITKLGMCKTNYFGMCEDKIIKQLRYLMGVLLPSTNQLLKTEKCKMSHCIFAWYLRKGVELLKHSRWYYFYIGQTMNRQRVLSFSYSFLFFLKTPFFATAIMSLLHTIWEPLF